MNENTESDEISINMGAMSIVDVMANALAGVKLEGVFPEDSRFPVVVNGTTRAYFELTAEKMGASLAGLCGAILNEVAAESIRRAEQKK